MHIDYYHTSAGHANFKRIWRTGNICNFCRHGKSWHRRNYHLFTSRRHSPEKSLSAHRDPLRVNWTMLRYGCWFLCGTFSILSVLYRMRFHNATRSNSNNVSYSVYLLRIPKITNRWVGHTSIPIEIYSSQQFQYVLLMTGATVT